MELGAKPNWLGEFFDKIVGGEFYGGGLILIWQFVTWEDFL